MGRLSPSHFDDVFLDKSKTVIVHVLAQLNKHGEIPHALALAPKARRERYALLTNQLGESFSLDDQDRGEDLDDGNEERLRRKENRKTIRREMARLSEFTYEQLVECLDPDDKFFKRLTEIIIKETAAQAYTRLQKEEATAASVDRNESSTFAQEAMSEAFATRARTALGNSGSMYFLSRDESGAARSRSSSSSSSNLTSISSASGGSPPPRDAATTRIARVGRLSLQDLGTAAAASPSASSIRADLMARRASLTAQRQALQLSREERRRERILRHIDSERPSHESASTPAAAVPSSITSQNSADGAGGSLVDNTHLLSVGAPPFVSRSRSNNFRVARSSSAYDLSTVPFPTSHGTATTNLAEVTVNAASPSTSANLSTHPRVPGQVQDSSRTAITSGNQEDEAGTSSATHESVLSLPRDLEARHQALEASLDRMRALRTSPARVENGASPGSAPHEAATQTAVASVTPPTLRRSGASRASLRRSGARSNSGARRIEDFAAFAARRRSGTRQQDNQLNPLDRVRSPAPELHPSAHQTFEDAFRALQRATTSIYDTLDVVGNRDGNFMEEENDVDVEIDGESGMAARYELASAGISLTEAHLRNGASSQRPIARLPARQTNTPNAALRVGGGGTPPTSPPR